MIIWMASGQALAPAFQREDDVPLKHPDPEEQGISEQPAFERIALAGRRMI